MITALPAGLSGGPSGAVVEVQSHCSGLVARNGSGRAGVDNDSKFLGSWQAPISFAIECLAVAIGEGVGPGTWLAGIASPPEQAGRLVLGKGITVELEGGVGPFATEYKAHEHASW